MTVHHLALPHCGIAQLLIQVFHIIGLSQSLLELQLMDCWQVLTCTSLGPTPRTMEHRVVTPNATPCWVMCVIDTADMMVATFPVSIGHLVAGRSVKVTLAILFLKV